MAEHSLWDGGAGLAWVRFDDGDPITVASAFYVIGHADWAVVGARVWCPADLAAGTLRVFVWRNVNGGATDDPEAAPLTSTTVAVVPGSWVEARFPLAYVPGDAVPFWLGYSHQAANDYVASQGTPPGSIQAVDGSPLYLAAGDEFGAAVGGSGRGRYVYARDTAPTEPVGWSAGIDAIVEDAPGGTPYVPPPLAADEETRALAYRAQAKRRAAALRARKAALGGSRSAREALTEAWAPVRAAQTDRKGPGGGTVR